MAQPPSSATNQHRKADSVAKDITRANQAKMLDLVSTPKSASLHQPESNNAMQKNKPLCC
ncbi:hypothetical protein CY34DRAFT_797228 [Suillus luteus UH-Slu-Lm8-n1]|uniref:Uncharacterized protein n=1 Tax=Suillus luteus UH-Slu-Lm8-n1 TaxID=930992 RepID=A0A0D0C302_9AGAM|nr:hypothetical protein CY34DRAFT_797228 [Suillus luteus UH-Slu-Lm8-n1]